MKFSKKAVEELGKLFLNMSLATFITTILQPVFNQKLNIIFLLIGFVLWLILIVAGLYTLNRVKES